jgi:hypothetical protein
LVFPAQRPASPDIAESPSDTTLSARAAAGNTARTIKATNTLRIRRSSRLK